jgi:hypothetical protein
MLERLIRMVQIISRAGPIEVGMVGYNEMRPTARQSSLGTTLPLDEKGPATLAGL